jgi:hypothetical protein
MMLHRRLRVKNHPTRAHLSRRGHRQPQEQVPSANTDVISVRKLSKSKAYVALHLQPSSHAQGRIAFVCDLDLV